MKIYFLKSLIVLFFLIYINNAVQSQICSPGPFTTQAQIDNFSTDYPGCTNVTGLQILCNGTSGITNLDGLSQITTISTSGGWGLDIESCQGLTSIDGLINLTSIDGHLFVFYNNDVLTDLSALDNVTHVSVDNVEIALNNTLSMCVYNGVCQAILNNHIIGINGNATGCNGEVAVGCGGSTVPVELISLKVKRNNKEVGLEWQVGSESNINHYLIEVSKDARNWSTIGSITAQNKNSYFYSFESSLSSLYVQLSEVNFNEEINNLGIRFLEESKDDFYIYPNPSNSLLYLNNTELGSKYNIYNNIGQLSLSGIFDENDAIDISSLEMGVYTIEYISPIKINYTSFIRKR